MNVAVSSDVRKPAMCLECKAADCEDGVCRLLEREVWLEELEAQRRASEEYEERDRVAGLEDLVRHIAEKAGA